MKYDIERSFSIHTIPLYIKQFFTYDHKKLWRAVLEKIITFLSTK